MTTAEEPLHKIERHLWDRLPTPLKGGAAVIAGAACVALVTGAALALRPWLPVHAAALAYILTVVAGAVAFGMQAGIVTALTAFLAYNYFFLPPTYTFTISDPRDLVSLLVFFAVAITTGSLAGRLREVAGEARVRARSLEVLNAFAMRLSAALSTDAITAALASEASKVSGRPAMMLRPAADGLTQAPTPAEAPPLSTADWQAAERCVATGQTSYPSAPGWPGQQYEFRSVAARGRVAAVLAIHRANTDDATEAMLGSMVHQAAIAIERLSFEAEKNAAEKLADVERLRSVMLSSVSHDIKTPLASIQGAVTSLRELGPKMTEESRADLLAAIEEETQRLSRFVTNILDMMRMESSPEVARDWVDLRDAAAVRVAHARKLMPRADIGLNVPESPAVIRGDEQLLERVFLNLLENAVNFSPDDAEIIMTVRPGGSGYRVEVEDKGVGIAAADLSRIFDKFYRGGGVRTRGTGLGLTICREVMSALGGTIAAESPISTTGGTRIILSFPANTPDGGTRGRPQ